MAAQSMAAQSGNKSDNKSGQTAMQEIQTIVNELNEQGIYLFVSDGKLKTKALPGAITPAHVSIIKGHKAGLIDFLTQTDNTATVALSHVDKSAGCELSYSQQRLWFLDKFEQGSNAYNMPMALKLTGEVNYSAVESAFRTIIRRHESLRTCYREQDGEVKQFVSEQFDFTLPLVSLNQEESQGISQGISEGTNEAQTLQTLMSLEAQKLFDLSADLMLRASLIQCSANEHVLLITMHHIASDGWSLGLVTKEFSALYNAAVAGTETDLPSLEYQYGDYAKWQKESLDNPQVKTAVSKFKQQFDDAPLLHSLPTDKPRPSEQSYNGDFCRYQLSAVETESLRELARQLDVSLFALLETAYTVLLSRYSGADDIVIGTPTANRTVQAMEPVIGFFVNTLVLRHQIDNSVGFAELVKANAATLLEAYALQHVPFEMLLDEVNPQRGLSYHPLFQTFIVFDNDKSQALALSGIEVEEMAHYHQFAKFDLSLYLYDAECLQLGWEYNTDLYHRGFIESMAQSFITLLRSVVAEPQCPVNQLPLVDKTVQRQLIEAHAQHDYQLLPNQSLPTPTVIAQIVEQANNNPDAVALVFHQQQLSYRQLVGQVGKLADWLVAQQVKPADRVAIYLPRKAEMVVAMLAVMACGGAYVPLDPDYPKQRLQHIVEDANVVAIVTDSSCDASHFGAHRPRFDVMSGIDWEGGGFFAEQSRSEAPAYLLYTSGSTGLPKGVVVSHANVSNLMIGLDERLCDSPTTKPISLLAVTSMSFDISVLELFWTLSRGHRVVLADSQVQSQSRAHTSSLPARKVAHGVNFSLYYFATDPDRSGTGKYDLLVAGAKFADQHGFEAVWMPERHFHEFGGQFPNPTITAAALSLVTENINLRAGSIVLPLHNPIQVAEDWSMVDNLSHGRAGVSLTCGWHFNDFVFAPDNYENRYEVMFEGIAVLQKLWRGEGHQSITGNGSEWAVKIRPLPVQPQIPLWVTTAGNTETFRRSGSIGVNLLTHILGQSPAQLAQNIQVYRDAREAAGFDRDGGRVTVMVHTFVCADMDTAYAIAKQPFKDYLRSSAGLLRPFAEAQGLGVDVDPEVLLEAGCQRYFRTNALFGTVEHCSRLALDLYHAGVDEIACLIDFGVDNACVIEHFSYLEQLHQQMKTLTTPVAASVSLSQQIMRHQVNWMQSTPSLMHLMLNEPGAAEAIAQLDTLMLGGEYLSPAVIQTLRPHFSGQLHNMYGPTETTVWSATASLKGLDSYIGKPISNTQFYVLDELLQLVPAGVIGELYIGGSGVTVGYHNQPDLTAERFIPDPFSQHAGQRLYRTGDLVRLRQDGYLDFYGRMDHQVKLRGFRIELGDIEKALLTQPQVVHVVAAVKQDQGQNDRLVAYVMARTDVINTESISTERVNSWQSLYDETFQGETRSQDPRFNFASWVSSYNQLAYPRELMLEWIGDTVSRIPINSDDQVLEIGVGTGLVLFRVAGQVGSYTGVDFSQNGLDYIADNLSYLGEKSANVALHHCAAHEFRQHLKHSFDTIILNSIVQYFPSLDYLTEVIAEALASLKPGGTVFIGDVRYLALLESFACSVECARAAADTKVIQLRHRLSQRVAQERELLMSPDFFSHLTTRFSGITRVEILPKPSQGITEMSKYRYDVILHTKAVETAATELTFQWQHDVYSSDEIQAVLQTQQPEVCVIDHLAHPLLADDLQNLALLASADPQLNLSDFNALKPPLSSSVDHQPLDSITAMAAATGYHTQLSWHHGAVAEVSLILRRFGCEHLAFAAQGGKSLAADHPLLSNNPLKDDQGNELIPQLQKTMQTQLPEFMQPDAYILVEDWPYTPNGKIDINNLPVPEAQVKVSQGYVAAVNELEQSLVDIWGEMLKVDQISTTDDFFDLGGRSLIAAQMLNRITQRWGIELSVKSLFENPTIKLLAQCISDGSTDSSEGGLALVAVGREGDISASQLQKGLWFAVHKDADGTMYNMATSIELSGELAIEAVNRSLHAVIDRHEILRSAFHLEQGNLLLDSYPEMEIDIPLVDLSNLPQAQQQQEIEVQMEAFRLKLFDLQHGPLIRLCVLRTERQKHILMFVIHHLISDGWSNRLLINEFFIGYQAALADKPMPWQPLAIQFADYSCWVEQKLDSEAMQQQLHYWQQQLAGLAPLLPLPWDKPRPSVASDGGQEIEFELADEVMIKLQQHCKGASVTPYMFFLSAWQLYLSAWSGCQDVAVGSPVSNRPNAELEKLVGYFVNTVVIRADVDDQHSWNDFLASVKQTTLDAYDNQDLPFGRVVEVLSPQRSASYMPIYQVSFSFESIRQNNLKSERLAVRQIYAKQTQAKYDLMLTLVELQQQIKGSFSFRLDLFDPATITAMTTHFSALLAMVLETPTLSVGQLKQHLQSLFSRDKEALLQHEQRGRVGRLQPRRRGGAPQR